MAIEFLRGERVTLRPFERRDLEAAQAWINEEGTRRFLGTVLLMAVLRAEYFAGRAEADGADARTERFGKCQDPK